MTGLRIIQPGLAATIQDEGRPGYRAFGVPPGGAFDRASFAMANALVANPPGCAAVELTCTGGEYEATATLAIGLAGAPMPATVVGPRRQPRTLGIPCSTTLHPGDRLKLGRAATEFRTYLAVAGGWLTPVTLGSRSDEGRLGPGRILEARPCRCPDRRATDAAGDRSTEAFRIIDGADSRWVGSGGWIGSTFRIGTGSDRMGLRLEGPIPTLGGATDRTSTPVGRGTIQHTGRGIIILGVACGTLGGYPQVGHLISADIDRLGQLGPGEPIRLERVELAEARKLDRQHRRMIRARLGVVRALAADGLRFD